MRSITTRLILPLFFFSSSLFLSVSQKPCTGELTYHNKQLCSQDPGMEHKGLKHSLEMGRGEKRLCRILTYLLTISFSSSRMGSHSDTPQRSSTDFSKSYSFSLRISLFRSTCLKPISSRSLRSVSSTSFFSPAF